MFLVLSTPLPDQPIGEQILGTITLLSFKLGELSNLFIDMVQREISCLKLNLTAFASEGTFFFICPTLFICGACYTLSDRILGV